MKPEDYLISYRQLIHDESRIAWWHWLFQERRDLIEWAFSKINPRGADRHTALQLQRRNRAGQQVEGESLTLANVRQWFPDVYPEEDAGL
jgi:hypothetical protein